MYWELNAFLHHLKVLFEEYAEHFIEVVLIYLDHCRIVLPLMQSYSVAGDFSSFGKLRSALYSNALYYGTYLVVFFVLMIYAAVKGVVLNALV